MKIRLADINDFKKEWNYSNTPTYKYFLNQLINENVEFWTIELSNKLIGELYIFWDSEDKDEANGINRAYLCAFRIKEEYQGQGYGKLLMNAVLKRIKSKGYTEVTIGIDNDNFLKLEEMYNKIGFIVHVKSTNVDYHYINKEGKPTTYKDSYMLKKKIL
ncbi:MAG: Acetyltransferase (GNAT) family protein [Candidatus Izimaplasma bacterium HR2]|nr:MAG: Acetyltransferase (GNAT) family protein [Candidatus Izimaplasma bacterium HR2]